MLRTACLTISLALLLGCSRTATTPGASPSAGDSSPTLGEQSEQELVVKEVVILGVTPGKTTLEEFKKQFHVAEAKDVTAQGVVTVDAGPGAELEADGLKFDRLTGAFLDGVLIDLKVRHAAPSPSRDFARKLGPPESSDATRLKWTVGGVTLIHSQASGKVQATTRVFDSAKSIEAFDQRGFAGLGDTSWTD